MRKDWTMVVRTETSKLPTQLIEWNHEPAAQATLIPILSTLVPTAPRAF